jgi:hypothetical protein
MTSAETGEPVQTASREFTISADGHLSTRAATAVTNASTDTTKKYGYGRRRLTAVDVDVVQSGRQILAANGAPSVTVTSEAAKYELGMKSCMPNSFFSELKTFIIKQTAVYMELDVLGFVRMPKSNSLYGTVVVIVTHIGRITVDGDTLSFMDDIGTIFKEAGFAVDKKGRRLMGLLEIVGFFNSIPAEKYACYSPIVDGPKPNFPNNFAADVTNYQACKNPMVPDALGGAQGADSCANITAADAAKLVTLPGQGDKKFAKSSGYQIVSWEQKMSLETWVMPARSDKYVFVEARRVVNASEPDMVATVSYMAKIDATLTTAAKLAAVVRTGYYCVDNYLNTSSAAPGKGSGFGTPPKDFSATYQGVTSIDGHASVRHWTVFFEKEFLWYLYDKAVDGQPGVYHPVRLEAIHAKTNTLVKVLDFGPMTVLSTADLTAIASGPGMNKPGTCFQHGTPLQGTSAGIDPGGGMIEPAQWLVTPSPYPDADKATIAFHEQIRAELFSMNLTGVADPYKSISGPMPTNPGNSSSSKRRRLQAEAMLAEARSMMDMDQPRVTTLQQPSSRQTRSSDISRRSLLGGDPPPPATAPAPTTVFSCCNDNGVISSHDSDIVDFDLNIGAISVGMSLSQTKGFSGGAYCYQKFDLDGSACGGISKVIELCVFIAGSGYFDWSALTGTQNCWEAGGCITKGLRVTLGGVWDIDIIAETICFLGGKGDDGGDGTALEPNCPTRSYAALSKGYTVGSSWFVAQASFTFYFKLWFPDDSCGRKDQYHFDPYVQIDVGFPCAFGHCHWWPSTVSHFMGQPGDLIDI